MKVLYDYHMHSEISPDAHFPMEEMCDSAVKKGLKEIAFTDHYEFYVNGVTKPYFNEAYKIHGAVFRMAGSNKI